MPKPRRIFDEDCFPSPDQQRAIRRAFVEKSLSIYQRQASVSPDEKTITLTSKHGLETVINILTDPETGAYLGLEAHSIPPSLPENPEQPYETLKRLYQEATEWNAAHPIGTTVIHKGTTTITRSALFIIGHDRPTIYIKSQRRHVPFSELTIPE
jgi:hypothetical protein